MNSIIKDYFQTKLANKKLASSTLENPADTSKTITSKILSNKPINEEDSKQGDQKVGIGVEGLLAASKKLLAINKGEAQPDNRDSLRFKQLLNVDDLIAERAALDAGKIKKSFPVSYRKTLLKIFF